MPTTAPWLRAQVQLAAEAGAPPAFALSGVVEAAHQRLDVLGICDVAGLAVFCGVPRDGVCSEIPRACNDHWPARGGCRRQRRARAGPSPQPGLRSAIWS